MSPTSASANGVIGATTESRLLLFLITMKFLAESLDLLVVKVMRWHNGFSRPMERLCPDDPSILSMQQRFTVPWRSRSVVKHSTD